MNQEKTLVLEIFSHPDRLKMNIFEKQELTTTLRHYSDSFISLSEINKISATISSVLNKINRRGFLESDLLVDLKKTGQLLYDQLLTKQVKQRLSKFEKGSLILSIDEQLVMIPWELLFSGEDFLCLKFNLGRSVRTDQFELEPHYRSVSTNLRMLILCNPSGDLPFAQKEGISIRNKLDKRRNIVHVDIKTSEIDTNYVKKNLRDYDLVHFAGHCEYNLRFPNKSGWVLKDGRFSAKDIISMAQSIPMPNIVFSNACQSADSRKGFIESSEKIYGLANAFLLSGVRHYIGTLWKVPDEMSLGFAQEFYGNIISGYSVGESVRRARSALIKKFGLENIIWASYLLYGDPTLTLIMPKKESLAKKPNIAQLAKAHKKHFAGVASFSTIIVIVFIIIKFCINFNPGCYLLLKKANSLFLSGDNQKAIEIYNEIIERDSNFINAYRQLGDIYDRLADRDSALKYYFTYAMLSEKRSDNKNLASAYIKIAWTYHMQGNYPKAYEFYEKGIALSKANKDKLNEADGLSKLAVWYTEKEDYERALELLLKSSQINKERIRDPIHRYNLACDYFNIGLLFVYKKDYSAAKEFYDASIKIFSKMKNKSDISDYYCNMGEIYSQEKEYLKALEYYFKSLTIDKELERRWDIGVNYNIIGELYLEIDELAQAEDYFNKALLMRQQINDAPGLAETYHNLGLLCKKRGQIDRAKEYLIKSLQIYKTIEIPNYKYVEEDLQELSL